jgi:hypothetical protein
MFPDHAPDRPRGQLIGSVQGGTNADLIATIAPLYLDGNTVLDVTYGRGLWWTRYQPDQFTHHDIDPTRGDGIDFRALPEPDHSIDVVCFDPPYIPQGGYDTSTQRTFADGYGLRSMSRAALWELHDAGLAECARVARRWVLAKCCDFVNGGAFWLGHAKTIELAARHGLAVHDLIVHHTGSGPGGHNIFTPLRARRHHSYLIIFKAPETTA